MDEQLGDEHDEHEEEYEESEEEAKERQHFASVIRAFDHYAKWVVS